MSSLGPLGHWKFLPIYCHGLFLSAIFFFSFLKFIPFSLASMVVYWKTWERGQALSPPRASTEALVQHAAPCSKALPVFSPVKSQVFRVIHSNGRVLCCAGPWEWLGGQGHTKDFGLCCLRITTLQYLYSHLLLRDNSHSVALGLSLFYTGFVWRLW